MGGTGTLREGWEIECTGVGGMNPLAIGKSCDDGVCRGSYIERRGISREEVTGGARVEDGPTFDGSGIGADCFEEGCGG